MGIRSGVPSWWAAPVVALAAVLFAPSAASPAAEDGVPAAILEEFQGRLDVYLKLRADLTRKIEPVSSTASAAELSARRQALAGAMRSARSTAKPGDVISPAMAAWLRETIAADFRARTAEARRAALQDVSGGVRLRINRPVPGNAPMPTVPPLLLAKLPVLPENLQYRFIDRHLALVDGDTQLIIDFVADALPKS